MLTWFFAAASTTDRIGGPVPRGVGTQVTFGSDNSDLVEAIRESTQESTNQAGQRIVEKDLNIQPTITVRPGWPLRVVVHADLVLRPYHQVQD